MAAARRVATTRYLVRGKGTERALGVAVHPTLTDWSCLSDWRSGAVRPKEHEAQLNASQVNESEVRLKANRAEMREKQRSEKDRRTGTCSGRGMRSGRTFLLTGRQARRQRLDPESFASRAKLFTSARRERRVCIFPIRVSHPDLGEVCAELPGGGAKGMQDTWESRCPAQLNLSRGPAATRRCAEF